MSEASFQTKVILSQPFAENTYICFLEGRNDCLVVDPGLDPQAIIDKLAELQLLPAAILNTHGHADHIAGNEAMKRCWPDCPLVIGAGDAAKLTDPVANLSAPFGLSLVSPQADVLVEEGETYKAAGMDLEVLHTPGHCQGHVVFVYKGGSPQVVIGGDVLFYDSIGRSDFPDGDSQQLIQSIHQKLFILPDDTIVLPGHGEQTTIGREKQFNPFVGLPAGYRP